MNEDLKKYSAESAPPKPKATINSFKSFGYSLNTAVADILDNSISAGARNIRIKLMWEGEDSYLTIEDDGDGMTKDKLIEAMTPGSKDPEEVRRVDDLGRFGMGLKSASFSQAKRLTVATKKEGDKFIYRTWDLDFIKDQWTLLNYISDESYLVNFPFKKGTIILWEKLYKLIPEEYSEKLRDKFKDDFYTRLDGLRRHLELVFHKYIEAGEIEIRLNERVIEAWNPFLTDSVGVVTNEEVVNGVMVRIHILPHVSKIRDISERIDYERMDLMKYQGFYLYRNKRLITYGGWNGLYKNDEFSKLARVEVNIGNEYDSEWSIDILKSKASPPLAVRDQLKVYARKARNESAMVYRTKGKKRVKQFKETAEYEYSPVWNTYEKDNKAFYELNKDHFLLKNFLKKESITKGELKSLLKLVSQTIPVDSILYYQNKDSNLNELRTEPAIDKEKLAMAQATYDHFRSQGFEKDKCIAFLLLTDPFDKCPEIVELIGTN